jgi:hypothetical protein
MSSSGYILNGVYHKARVVPLDKMLIPQQSTFKLADHARQRFDHSAEILQPYDHNGKPNKKFIEANPDAAVEYGFLPNTEPGAALSSDTPLPGDPNFGGSIPWGQVAP